MPESVADITRGVAGRNASHQFDQLGNVTFANVRAKSLHRIVQENGGSKCKNKAAAINSLARCFKIVACSSSPAAVCNECRQFSELSVMCQLEENDFLEGASSLYGTFHSTRDLFVRPYGCWLMSPITVQAHGAFPKLLHSSVREYEYTRRLRYLESLLRAPADSPPRRHLLRHRNWWDSDAHGNMLDELYTAERDQQWPAEAEDMSPPQLLNRLREMTVLRQVLTSQKHFTYVSLHTNTCSPTCM
jgi:hypothetical protein